MNLESDSITRPKIFISAPYLQLEWEKYSHLFENFNVIIPKVEERMEEDMLLNMFDEHPDIVSGIVGDDKFTEEVYRKSNLKFLVKWGTGIDSLNRDIANKYNIRILNTPSAFTIPVSESAIGMMLNFCRTIGSSDENLKNGNWEKIQGYTLNESSVGIIGLGNIGSEVAKKLEIFGSKINYYDPNVNNFKYNRYSDLKEMIINSDIITIHCDLNDTSYYLIGKEELQLMRDKILINTARGPIINNVELENYITSGNNIYIGLDVFVEEPLPKDSILRKCKSNVILSAHNTNTSPKFWENVHLNSIKMINDNI